MGWFPHPSGVCSSYFTYSISHTGRAVSSPRTKIRCKVDIIEDRIYQDQGGAAATGVIVISSTSTN